MATSKGLGQRRQLHSRYGDGYRSMGRRLFDKGWGAITTLGFAVISRERLCASLMVVFCATVVAPSVFVFYDRAMPFDYIAVTPVEKIVHPGQAAHVAFIVDNVRKTVSGEFDRYFYDVNGKAYYLGTFQTIYHKLLPADQERGIRFEKEWVVPWNAPPGDGTYVVTPRFGNLFQMLLYPIAAPSQKVHVTVAPRPAPQPAQ